jgi:cobyrinic acid a,c-diamide synthase
MSTRGLLIAGTHSGSGKTTVTLGLLAALKRRGLTLAPFKVGPDFIDPGHHTRVLGRTSRNLDGWMLPAEYNRRTFNRHCVGADIAVVEGVMGLYDGFSGNDERGSSAQMAKWLNLPVLLVVDARSMARSAAALVKGFVSFDRDLQFAGVIFNRIGSPGHLQMLKQALEAYVPIPCWGGIPRDEAIAMPERHLGLVTTEDNPLSENALAHLAVVIEKHIDLDAVWRRLPLLPADESTPIGRKAAIKPVVRIAVARDAAFCFYYPENLEALEANQAEVVFFSPLTDKSLPPGTSGLYLGGGYPELYAEGLAANRQLRQEIAAQSRKGMPIYAECGGFMYLCREILDHQQRTFPLVGVFPYAIQMLPRLKSLGYREITLQADSVIGRRGTVARGHEFHYSEILPSSQTLPAIYRLRTRTGDQRQAEGFQINQTLGSYVHLHFGSQAAVPAAFVAGCLQYNNQG